MPIRLECPICEYQFEVARESSPTTSTCPECNRTFQTLSAVVATEEKPKRDKLILPEQIVASALPPTRTAQQDSSNADVVPLPHDTMQENPDVPVQLVKRMYAKQPGKAFPLAVIGVLFAIAAGLLIYLPYVINGSINPVDNATSQKTDQGVDPVVPIPRSPDKTAVDWNPVQQSTDDLIASFADRPDEMESAKLDPPPPKRNPKRAPASIPEFFTELQLQDCWREHHSRVVRLNIANSLGEKQALGTLVDSRGWILTSYQAIAGAIQIRVTQSASSFEQFQAQEPFNDLVRGVLAVDREHDLAILAINRRFVVNFSDLKRSHDDLVAAGDHLVQFGLIDDDTPLLVRETQVIGRPTFSDADADAAKYFADTALNADSFQWLTLSNLQGIVGGAPLLTIEGELVGMCTEQPAAAMGYAVPVAALNPLLKSIETDAKTDGGNSPLTLAAMTENIEQVGQPDSSPGISVDVDSAYRQVSIQLNQIGTQCSQFDWVPKNLDQYRLLQEFSRQLIAINNSIYEIPDDPDLPDATANLANRATLQEQSERWAAALKSSLAPQPLPPNQVGKFNEVAAQAIQLAAANQSQPEYVISYVRVRLGAMDSPKRTAGVDTVTLDIDQTDDIVMVPFDDRFPPMRPETLWLAIYVVDDPGKISFVDPDTNEKHEAHAGAIVMVLGPLD